MKTIVIDRQKWTRGRKRTHDNPCHYCVGAYIGNAFTREDLGKWYTTQEFMRLAQLDVRPQQPWGCELVNLNDSLDLTDQEREAALTELCAKAGYTLEFIN